MKKHNHTKCVANALEKAEEICQKNGARLTNSRKRVLELIWQSHRASKAYDLLEALQKEDKSAKPPTIYRALEFLEAQGLVHKIESLNAYMGCTHAEAEHDGGHFCQFLICTKCGDVSEFCDESIYRSINENAKKLNFKSSLQTVEVQGTCSDCNGGK